MSRVSIERRMERVRDAVLPPNSYEWRLSRLPDDLKREYLTWRDRCDAINSENEKQGRNLYELAIAGHDVTPPMPVAVYRALWPNGEGRAEITVGMSVSEAAQLYEAMLNEGVPND